MTDTRTAWTHIEGKRYLSFEHRDGKRQPQRQGEIIHHIGDGYYLTQQFEWAFGTPSSQIICHIREMDADGWELYDTDEELQDATRKYQ